MEIGGESRPALRNTVGFAIFETEHLVAAVGIHQTVVQLVEDTEVTADAVEGAAGLQTAHDMHARIKRDPVAGERLQAAARVRTAFQDSHRVTLLCQQRSREQASDAAADDMYVFFHFYAMMG